MIKLVGQLLAYDHTRCVEELCMLGIAGQRFNNAILAVKRLKRGDPNPYALPSGLAGWAELFLRYDDLHVAFEQGAKRFLEAGWPGPPGSNEALLEIVTTTRHALEAITPRLTS